MPDRIDKDNSDYVHGELIGIADKVRSGVTATDKQGRHVGMVSLSAHQGDSSLEELFNGKHNKAHEITSEEASLQLQVETKPVQLTEEIEEGEIL